MRWGGLSCRCRHHARRKHHDGGNQLRHAPDVTSPAIGLVVAFEERAAILLAIVVLRAVAALVAAIGRFVPRVAAGIVGVAIAEVFAPLLETIAIAALR